MLHTEKPSEGDCQMEALTSKQKSESAFNSMLVLDEPVTDAKVTET